MSDLVLLLSLLFPFFLCLGVIAQAVMPTGPQVVTKPLEWFKVKSNARKRFEEGSLRALGQDMRKRQISPLVCVPDGTIVCGERRYHAAMLEGLPSLDVIIITDAVDEAERRRLQLVENLHRQDLSNAEKAEGCVEFVRCNPEMPLHEIAAALGFDPGMVTRWRGWEKAIIPVKEALADDKLTLNDFYKLSQLPQDQQAAALEATLNGKKSAKKSSAKMSRLKCEMPSGMMVTLAGEGDGLSLDEVIETLAELLKAAKKANEEQLDAKTWVRVLRDKARA